MNLFRHVMGGKLFTIAAGFNMIERKPDTHLISWCDPDTMSWEMTPENQAGYFKSPVALSGGVSLLENSFRLNADEYDVVVSYVGRPIVFGFNFVPCKHYIAQAKACHIVKKEIEPEMWCRYFGRVGK